MILVLNCHSYHLTVRAEGDGRSPIYRTAIQPLDYFTGGGFPDRYMYVARSFMSSHAQSGGGVEIQACDLIAMSHGVHL
jgi:hypothetical protein